MTLPTLSAAALPDVAQWDLDPIGSFREFVTSEAFMQTSSKNMRRPKKCISEKSAAVNTYMFGKFARWLSTSGKQFTTLSAADLREFLELGSSLNGHWVPDLDSRIKQRYLRLIERCYTHLGITQNPAQHALFAAMREARIGKDRNTIFLTAEQLPPFLDALPGVPASTAPWEKGSWKTQRNRLMQLLMLCSGLKVAEVIGLHLTEIDRQRELDGGLTISLNPVDKHDTSYAHQTIIQPVAVPEVVAWLDLRDRTAIPGDLLFPANLAGKPLHKTSLYRQVSATFIRAALSVPRSGGRTLRSTFAVDQLRAGVSATELTEQLGLALTRSVEPYIALAER